MTLLIVVALSALVALALLALFHSAFEDNLPQFYGLWGIIFGGTGEVVHLLTDGQATAARAVTACGVLFFALGTYLKVRRHHRQKKGKSNGVGAKTY